VLVPEQQPVVRQVEALVSLMEIIMLLHSFLASVNQAHYGFV
jgi:hypothetical protein